MTPTADQIAAKQRFEATIPTCSSQEECERLWAVARRWVLDNAAFKIQNYSGDYMETFNNQDFAETNTWARVTKEPTDPTGTFKILVELGCNNPLGCSISPLARGLQSFNDYVNAAKR